MKPPERGEVWIVDLRLAAKVRPALVLSIPATDKDKALVTVVPHTTSLRDTRFEVRISVTFLHPGGFDTQSLATIPFAKLVRRLGCITPQQLSQVEYSVCMWLGLKQFRSQQETE